MPTLRARIVFLIGLLLAVGFWIWSSFYIWDISLSGNYRITEDVFSAFLSSQKVTVGMAKGDLDIESLEKDIRRAFTEITWTSARLTGTKLMIEVKENDAPIAPEVETSDALASGTDLVSDHKGIIVEMIVRKGIPKASIGDEVEAGTLLVEGKIPIFNEEASVRGYRYVEADADVLIEYEMPYQDDISRYYAYRNYSGKEKYKYFVKIGRKYFSPDFYKIPYDRYEIWEKDYTPDFIKKMNL